MHSLHGDVPPFGYIRDSQESGAMISPVRVAIMFEQFLDLHRAVPANLSTLKRTPFGRVVYGRIAGKPTVSCLR